MNAISVTKLESVEVVANIPEWPDYKSQSIIINGYKYLIEDVIAAASEEKKFKKVLLPLKGMNLNYAGPCDDSLLSFTAHVLAVFNVDMSFPIILSPTGVVMDGRHRIIRALLTGETHIMSKQLISWPKGEPVEDDEK